MPAEGLPRLIATDLDGTLLRSDGTISARTITALHAVMAMGVRIVVTTARPPRYLAPVAEALGVGVAAVCANGAIVYDLRASRAVRVRAIAEATARRVVGLLAVALPEVGFAVETGVHLVHEPRFAKPLRADLRVAVADVAQLWHRGNPVVKLLAWSATTSADVLLEVARRATAHEQVECTHSGGAGMLEVSAAGVSKVASLAAYCGERQISSADVMAFGDMPNDLAMLAWAGTGYAVANAHPSVLAATVARTASNDEDGVALVLERLLAKLG